MRNVDCKTTHSIASPARECVLSQGKGRRRGDSREATLGWPARSYLWEAIGTLNGGRPVNYDFVTIVMATLDTWLQSSDPCIAACHVPTGRDVARAVARAGQQYSPEDFVRIASELWARARDPMDVEFSISHNGYLKLFALSQPTLLAADRRPYDFILVDEAQVRGLIH